VLLAFEFQLLLPRTSSRPLPTTIIAGCGLVSGILQNWSPVPTCSMNQIVFEVMPAGFVHVGGLVEAVVPAVLVT
jgi:hypothetical protein